MNRSIQWGKRFTLSYGAECNLSTDDSGTRDYATPLCATTTYLDKYSLGIAVELASEIWFSARG